MSAATGGPRTALGLLPPPGFSSIAIPIPQAALWSDPDSMNPFLTTKSPSTSPESHITHGVSTRRRFPPPPAKPEWNGAYTLLIVDDNPIQRKIMSKICERWGQPYELAENGQQAVAMYKADPERFRCILMDAVMPVMDGFEATRQIRAFEEESWSSLPYTSHSTSPSPSLNTTRPIRRAVIVAMVPNHVVSGLKQRIIATGFDLSVSQPIQIGILYDMLFSAPGVNAVGVYGGVDENELREAGYPLQIITRKPSSIGEKEVGEALGRAVT
ncbi:CheY-like superfamily [Xylariales sp. AK1849]|nr:CheY-like superfamily [Xylariales sp. AK1849]